MAQFNGFDPTIREFLHTLKENNSREWYNNCKERYKVLVYKPFSLLTEDLTRVIYEIDKDILTKPSKCISRIYRDSRFSKDKTLYRENVWITFSRAIYEDIELPSYYFEINPTGYSYGMGYYMPKPYVMSAFRKHITAEPKKFLNALKVIEKNGKLYIEGDLYKKPKLGEVPCELAKWGYYKNFYVTSNNIEDFNHCYSSKLVLELEKCFKALAPLYDFIIKTPIEKINYNNDILL